MLNPFQHYIGAQIDTGKWFPEKMGERVLLGIDSETQQLKVGFYFPSVADCAVNETHLLPMADCKLILRSFDDDVTNDELNELDKMGYCITTPRHYICDNNGDRPSWRLEQVAQLTLWLVSKHFSVGAIPKSMYLIKNDRPAA